MLMCPYSRILKTEQVLTLFRAEFKMDVQPAFGYTFSDSEDGDVYSDDSKFASSGYEYLKRAHLEAQRCPQVVVANMDTSCFANKQTVTFEKKPGFTPATEGYGASSEWLEQQSADFADIRQAFVHYCKKLKSANLTAAAIIPKKTDEESWCRFCLGQNMTSRILEMRDSNELDAQDQNVKNGGMPPLLTVMAQMNQPTVLKVLDYHVGWLQKVGFSHLQGQWLYALLVCVEKPLTADVTSLLRTLARKCADLRAVLESPEHEFLAPLNLLIGLVFRYFEQFDLG